MSIPLVLAMALAITPGTYVDPLTTAPELGTIVRPFDPPAQPWLPGHRGVDLAGAPGAPVYAAGTGTVVFAGDINHVGVVSIAHDEDGIRTTYQPLQPVVRKGEVVTKGMLIGHLTDASALSFGVRRDRRTYVDPQLLYRRPVIRLKPVDGTSGRPRPGARS